MRSLLTLSSSIALLAVVISSCGCRDADIAVYRVAKEQPKPADHQTPTASVSTAPTGPAAGADMANTPVVTATGSELSWRAAPAWQSKPAGAMRKGSYTVTNATGEAADLSITAFPGDVGGIAANVNRWRGQLQLPPLGESEVAASLTRLNHNALEISYVDLTSPAPPHTRMLGAIVPHGGATWFFKLMGPDAVVAAEKATFLEFLNSVQPAAAKATP